MHVIVAGGTSPTLGRSIVSACIDVGHDVTILSRMSGKSDSTVSTKFGATIRHVSYDDVDSLNSAIAGSHVVVSVLKLIGDELNIRTHLLLLQACLATSTITRFVPSDWSMYPLAQERVDVLAHKAKLLESCQEAVRISGRTDFEVAQFKPGGFLNYFAQKAPSVDRKPYLLGGLEDPMMLKYINIAEGVLPIPTDAQGKPAKVSMTHLDDIGKYIAAAVSLPPGSWPSSGSMNIAGNTFTYEDVRLILEEACNIRIRHEVISGQDCVAYEVEAAAVLARGFDLNAFIARMVAQMQKVICSGNKNGSWSDNDLATLCPSVVPVDLKTYLIDIWAYQ